jgi:hypothetical protein
MGFGDRKSEYRPPHTPVESGGERMSECGFILAQGESCPKCQERKPLDERDRSVGAASQVPTGGYDWRARLLVVERALTRLAMLCPDEANEARAAVDDTEAHIESLNTNMDALVSATLEFAASVAYTGDMSEIVVRDLLSLVNTIAQAKCANGNN